MNAYIKPLANKFELHYCLSDKTHSMNAFVRNKCENELLAIVKEIASILELDIIIESEALKEGGLTEIWTFISNNAILVAIITNTLINVLSTFLSKDRKMAGLQKEELRLSIKKLKQELKENKENQPIINIENLIFNINKDVKVSKHKSNFYKKLNLYKKVSKIKTNLLTEGYQPVDEPQIIERKDFHKFILPSDKLEPIIDEKATIEIISPVLKQGNFKWKGLYKGETIDFFMKDKDFRNQIIKKGIPFKNGTCIDCVLEISRKIDDFGDIIKSNYAVSIVKSKHDENITIETPQGRKYKSNKEAIKKQTNLFANNER